MKGLLSIALLLLAGFAAYILGKNAFNNLVFSFGVGRINIASIFSGVRLTIPITIQNKNPFAISFCCLNAELSSNGVLFAQSAMPDRVQHKIGAGLMYTFNHDVFISSSVVSVITIKDLIAGKLKAVNYNIRLKIYGIPLTLTGTENL